MMTESFGSGDASAGSRRASPSGLPCDVRAGGKTAFMLGPMMHAPGQETEAAGRPSPGVS
jgi:hypothetical protein